MRTFLLVALVAVTLVSWLPFLGLVVANVASSSLGCRVDEVAPHPCMVRGLDFGPFLHVAMMTGWLILVVWPGMLATAAIWLGLAAWAAIRAFRRRASSSRQSRKGGMGDG
ncbi:hypothetical protein [Inquilinus sp. CAU 1745]|uniref:hypothetical protein n=1 Tax=Inquilinus sp. CAU 1745 TaxID=3140369 RepID=UPI00325AEA54